MLISNQSCIFNLKTHRHLLIGSILLVYLIYNTETYSLYKLLNCVCAYGRH